MQLPSLAQRRCRKLECGIVARLDGREDGLTYRPDAADLLEFRLQLLSRTHGGHKPLFRMAKVTFRHL